MNSFVCYDKIVNDSKRMVKHFYGDNEIARNLVQGDFNSHFYKWLAIGMLLNMVKTGSDMARKSM